MFVAGGIAAIGFAAWGFELGTHQSGGSNPSFRAGVESAQPGGTAYRMWKTGMGIPAACGSAYTAATGIGPDKWRENYDESGYMRGCTGRLGEAKGE